MDFQPFYPGHYPDASLMTTLSLTGVATEVSGGILYTLLSCIGFPKSELHGVWDCWHSHDSNSAIDDACFHSGKWTREILLSEASHTPKFTGPPVLGWGSSEINLRSPTHVLEISKRCFWVESVL